LRLSDLLTPGKCGNKQLQTVFYQLYNSVLTTLQPPFLAAGVGIYYNLFVFKSLSQHIRKQSKNCSKGKQTLLLQPFTAWPAPRRTQRFVDVECKLLVNKLTGMSLMRAQKSVNSA
jgi:hypothetical protein